MSREALHAAFTGGPWLTLVGVALLVLAVLKAGEVREFLRERRAAAAFLFTAGGAALCALCLRAGVPWPRPVPLAGAALLLTGLFLSLSRDGGGGGDGGTAAELGGWRWDVNDFCRHWLITGGTGTGKTVAAINNLIFSVFKHNPRWGGLAVDDKGTFLPVLRAMAAHFGREDDLIVLASRPDFGPQDDAALAAAGADPEEVRARERSWKPLHALNPFSCPGIPAGACADTIVTTYKTVTKAESGEHNYFEQQARDCIEMGIELMWCLHRVPAMHEVNAAMQDGDLLRGLLARVKRHREESADPLFRDRCDRVTAHFGGGRFLGKAPEELSGVRGTVQNYLKPFETPEIVEVFGRQENTIEFSAVEHGKIFCVAVPQKHGMERRYLCALFKQMLLNHALRRFDGIAAVPELRAGYNLLICWADEAQRFLSGKEDVDVLRESRTALVAATQQHDAFYPVMGEKTAKPFMGNLANRVAFRAASEESALATAQYLGKRDDEKRSRSVQRGGVSFSYSPEERFRVRPMDLLDEARFPKFTAIVYHASRGWKRLRFTPLVATPRGLRRLTRFGRTAPAQPPPKTPRR